MAASHENNALGRGWEMDRGWTGFACAQLRQGVRASCVGATKPGSLDDRPSAGGFGICQAFRITKSPSKGFRIDVYIRYLGKVGRSVCAIAVVVALGTFC